MLVSPFGVSDAELPLPELTMLSGEKDGAGIPLPCAHKQDRKRTAASSRNAVATEKVYHGRIESALLLHEPLRPGFHGSVLFSL